MKQKWCYIEDSTTGRRRDSGHSSQTYEQNAIEKAWTSACATHAEGYIGIQIHQPDKDGNIEVLTFAARQQPHNNDNKDERPEDKRFRAAVMASWAKVWMVARHLYRRGAAVRVAPW